MSTNTQILPPTNDEDFEEKSIVLWRRIINDPNVKRHGKRGSRQQGVDLYGRRDQQPDKIVGIQCKCKEFGKELDEGEVRSEVKKALTFKPDLIEYFITTTAPNKVKIEELARIITRELYLDNRVMTVHVWGWETLQTEIRNYTDAMTAFDAGHSPYIEEVVQNQERQHEDTRQILSENSDDLRAIRRLLESGAIINTSDTTHSGNPLIKYLEEEVDRHRVILQQGQPRRALSALREMLNRLRFDIDPHVLFRIKANLGQCHAALGEYEEAAEFLRQAVEHAPSNPKSIANNVLLRILNDQWGDAFAEGRRALEIHNDNEDLVFYVVQAAAKDTRISDPRALVPDCCRSSALIALACIGFYEIRGEESRWIDETKTAASLHPEDRRIQIAAAEATIADVIRQPDFQRTRKLLDVDRRRIEEATSTLGPVDKGG